MRSNGGNGGLSQIMMQLMVGHELMGDNMETRVLAYLCWWGDGAIQRSTVDLEQNLRAMDVHGWSVGRFHSSSPMTSSIDIDRILVVV